MTGLILDFISVIVIIRNLRGMFNIKTVPKYGKMLHHRDMSFILRGEA